MHSHHPARLNRPVAWALAVAVAALLTLPAGNALASHVRCGDVITTDMRLDRDLSGCPGDGIVIGAGDITLDLGGHTIHGSGSGTGIDDSAGHDGVRITNGTVSSFASGVVLIDADDSRISRLTVTNTTLGGISLVAGSDRNRVDHNVVAGNALDGIFLLGSGANRIEHNAVSGGESAGVAIVEASNANRVRSNTIAGNALGIAVGVSHRNEIDHNVLSDNSVLGIVLDGSDETVLRKNSTSGSELFGILITGSDRTAVHKNTAARNGDDGIHVDGGSTATVLNRNRADDNSDLGIDALDAVTDAGGNRASGNGNPAQCVGVTCS